MAETNWVFVERFRGRMRRVTLLNDEFEVISTHDLALNVEERLDDFLHAGVPLAWLIYSNTRHVQVFHQGRPALRLGPDDVLDGEDVLPGFSCPVAEIFVSL